MFKIEKRTVKGSASKTAMKMVRSKGAKSELGSGCYGTVYGGKNSKVVYKVGDATDNDGYLSFVKAMSKQKKQNPYLPVIHSVRIIKDNEGSEYFVVAMERLDPLPKKNRAVVGWFNDALHGGLKSYKGAEFVGIKVDFPPELRDAIKVLKRAYKLTDGYCDWDIHDGNFMMRGKQVVVIDPLA